jgi:hypothetical protein
MLQQNHPIDTRAYLPPSPHPQLPSSPHPQMHVSGAGNDMLATISPLQTSFDPNRMHFDPNQNFYSHPHSTISQHPTVFQRGFTPINLSRYDRRYSAETSIKRELTEDELNSAGPSKRRKSMPVEPGSERATYLEKNRQAASKCRTKQRRQQEQLIINAREVERMNKILHHEVDRLKAEMRSLMGYVAMHNDCPDQRLRMYIQREADKIAAGVSSFPSARPQSIASESNEGPSPKTSEP